jgi:hypothetical protein
MWFDVSKHGLAKLLDKKGKWFAIFELIQNAWDTRAKKVDVTITPVSGQPYAHLTVEDDDPDGFQDLSHSFTLFAESAKKDDPEKRGRFNLGEKLVLALCEEATVESTKGTVHFKSDGTRSRSSHKRPVGSCFTAKIRMTRGELVEVMQKVRTLIPPPGIVTTFNGEVIASRDPIKTYEKIQLKTKRADEEGNIVDAMRQTTIRIYEPLPGEAASIYEMGIPVVATGDRFHVDVAQKVPVNLDRDNVPPSYLRVLRALVLEATVDRLSGDNAAEVWVTEALSHPAINAETVERALTARFGEKRAVYDPSDREANMRLTGQGYTVVSGKALPPAVWDNVRSSGAMLPSGRIAPTPKPYSDDPNADAAELYPREEWTVGMEEVADLVEALGYKILDRSVRVLMVKTRMPHRSAAAFGPSGDFSFFVAQLGKKWFDNVSLENLLGLITHEFGHDEGAGHLEDRYHEKLCEVSGKLGKLALREPDLFFNFTKKGR